MRLILIFFIALLLFPTSSFAEDGKQFQNRTTTSETAIPDLTGTPWAGISVPAGTKIKTEEQNDGKVKRFLILPSGFWIHENDSSLDICEKQCWGIAQPLKIGEKTFSLTRRGKREVFEPHICQVALVSLNNDISDRRKFFSDKGWANYQEYVALVRKLFPDILAQNFKSGVGFIDGTQKYYYRGKGDYLSFHAFGRLVFEEIRPASYDTDGGFRSLMDRALLEIYIDFLPKGTPEEGYIIDKWETQIFPKKW